MSWKRFRRGSRKSKRSGWPMYVRHKRTGWKATLFGISNKSRMRKDLASRGFEVISHWEFYGIKRKRKRFKRRSAGIRIHKYDGRYHNKGKFDFLTYLRKNHR